MFQLDVLTVEWSNNSPYIEWGERSLHVGCTTSNTIYLEFLQTWLMVHFVFSTILPFFFLILSNCLIISKVVQNNLRRQERLNVSSKVKDNERLPGLAAMLLTVSFSYIILCAPYHVSLMLNQHVQDVERKKVAAIVESMSYLIKFVNNAINFWLYCASGSAFRATLKEAVCETKRSKGKSTSAFPGTSPTAPASETQFWDGFCVSSVLSLFLPLQAIILPMWRNAKHIVENYVTYYGFYRLCTVVNC